MKTLARLALWLLVLAIGAGTMATGLGGMIFLPSMLDIGASCALAIASLILGAVAMDQVVGIAYDDVKLDVMIDWFRVRNWRRRRAWRPYAAALAGQSTAASFVPPAYR